MRLYLLIILSYSVIIFGSVKDSVDVDINSKSTILPFAFYTSDTSVALGVFGMYEHNKNEKIFGNFIYTLKNQKMFFIIADFDIRSIIFEETFKIKDYYSKFYGIGNTSDLDDSEKYNFFIIDNTTNIGSKFKSKNLTGYISLNNFYYEAEKKFISYNGKEYSNGIGIKLSYDNVSDKFYRDGGSFSFSYLYYPELLSNIKEFSVMNYEFAFFRSFNMSALNILLKGENSYKNVHFEKLSGLGGSETMRGYPERRFIDKNIITLDLEYDFRIYRELSASLFTSVGDVYNDHQDLSLKNLKFAYGTGLLYKYKSIFLRFDVATSLEKEISIIATGIRAF